MMESMETDQENNNRNNRTISKSDVLRRNCYLNLIDRLQQIQESEDTGLHTVKELGEILQEVNALDQDWHIEDNVNKIEDTLTDSQVLSTASAILVKCIKAVQTADSTYEATEFAEKIRNSIGNREEEINQKTDWFKLLEDARHIVLEIPQYAFTYGTFDITKVPEPKVKKQKTRDAPEQLVKKRLENIVSVEKEEAGINEIVAFLQKVLQSEYIKNNRQPINYYKYVIDTSSFATTVENMFYCSFLIRNGTAAMAVDESGQPSIKPVSKNRLTTFREEGGKNIQMIASISMEEWENLQVGEGFLQQYRHKNLG